MKYIKKLSEPNSLVAHRKKEHADYNNIPTDTKEEIKQALLTEQGYICCYCMKRINKENIKLEHWKPQSKYPERSLIYKNMLGVCNGNEGEPKHLQCCDTHKGNWELSIDPLSPHCETFIKYSADGIIFSDDEKVNRDLNDVLNLNQQKIQNNRRIVMDVLIQYLLSKYVNKGWTKSAIQKEINKWSSVDSEGKYKEYCEVALFRLKKLYRKAQA